MQNTAAFLIAALIGTVILSHSVQVSAVSVQSRELYENHCTECHTSALHIREKKKARSLDDIEGFVNRWQSYLRLNWQQEEIDAVVEYLNEKFYRY